MKAEDRKELELYAAGRLPAERTTAIERLVFDDEEARQLLVQLIDKGEAPRPTRKKSHGRQRRRSSRSQKRDWRKLLTAAVVVVAGTVTAVIINRFLPAPVATSGRTAAQTRSAATAVDLPPVFHPPVLSPTVELYESANSVPRHPEVAARALLYRERGFTNRSPVDEVLALELANAGSDLAVRLEPIAVISEQRSGRGNRIERHREPGRRLRPNSPSDPAPVGDRSLGGAAGRVP